MKINFINDRPPVKEFKDIKIGNVFVYDGDIFIKIRELNTLTEKAAVNAIYLQTGEPKHIHFSSEVIEVEASLVVKEWE